MKYLLSLIVVGGSLMLAGCPLKELVDYQPPEQRVYPAVIMTDEDITMTPLERLMVYYNSTESLSAQERSEQYSALMAKLNEGEEPMLRLRLVMLMLEGSDKDREQARQYLAPLYGQLQRENEQELAGFVLMLNRLLLRNSKQRSAATSASDQLAAKEEEIQVLLKQINALKSIEKSIYEREYGIGERDAR